MENAQVLEVFGLGAHLNVGWKADSRARSHQAGVRPGWRLQNLAGEAASGELAELQAKLKAGMSAFRGISNGLVSGFGLETFWVGSSEAAELPVTLTFKGLGKLEDFCVSCQARRPCAKGPWRRLSSL